MVGLRHLNHVDAGFLQKFCERDGFLFQKPAFPEEGSVFIDRDQRKFVLDGQGGRRFPDRLYDFQGIPDAVPEASAVFVGAPVQQTGAQRSDQTVPVYLDRVCPRSLRPQRTRRNTLPDLCQQLP